MDAVLDAATELFAEQGPRAATVRDIAAHAGVNHALVHRYFGSKQDLLRAVLARQSQRFSALAESSPDVRAAISTLFRDGTVRGPYIHTLARAVMDGLHPERLVDDFPTVRALLGHLAANQAGAREDPAGTALAGPAEDARILVAGIAALALGWHIFEDYLVAAVQLADEPRERVSACIERLLLGIAALTGEPSSSRPPR